MSGLHVPPRPHRDNVVAIADYAELECFRRQDGSVSMLDIARIVQRASDSDESLAEDEVTVTVREAFGDLESRVLDCGAADGRYPFDLNAVGTVLALRTGGGADPMTMPPDVYVFLLLTTRMNMRDERRQGGHDGALLFEELCSHVAACYWGAPHHSIGRVVFGTARFSDRSADDETVNRNSFSSAIVELCNELREGGEFAPKDDGPVLAKDAKLDLVVWKRFADQRSGQLIGFGQCKTGTHWDAELAKLQPDAFCRTWLRTMPAVTPVRMFFVSARVRDRWYERSTLAGILFDRCRMMEFASDVPQELLERIRKWVHAAMHTHGLSFP